jgi:outer membrane protein TolC
MRDSEGGSDSKEEFRKNSGTTGILLDVNAQESFGWRRRRGSLFRGVIALLLVSAAGWAQAPQQDSSQAAGTVQSAATPPVQGQPAVITLEEAIRRAQSSDPAFAAAQAAGRSAALDRSIAIAGLLPNAHLNSQDIYTQPNGIYSQGDAGQPLAPLPRFVSNDSRPWEYMAQGVVDETFSLAGAAGVRRAKAAAAQAAAEQEIARRGLIAGVTSLFYSALAAEGKVAVARQAREEAADFTKITQEREQVREAAHADVVKAQLEEQTRDRELQDAQLATEKAHLELGVLLYPDPRTPYTLSAAQAAPPLASREDIDAAASKNNAELKSALAALSASKADVLAARAAYLPDVRLDVIYGIDANQFAVKGPLNPDGTQARNLGYSTSFTVNLPVWDWLATEHKVKQSEIRSQVAQVTLTNTQRQLIAKLDEAYAEAVTARDQLASLDQSVATAAESLRLTKAAYQGGERTVLEVVDAQNAFVLAQNARQDGRVRYETALANLQTLTGTM